MKGLGVNDVKSALIVLPDYNENVYLSGRNIENARLMNVKDINTFEVLNATDMVLFESAVAKFV